MKAIYLILLLALTTLIRTEEEDEKLDITESTEKKISDSEKKTFFYRLNLQNFNTKFLKIRTVPYRDANPAYIYLRKDDSRPSRNNALLLSEKLGDNVIIFPKKTFSELHLVYLGLTCLSSCDFTVYFDYVDEIELNYGEKFSYETLEEQRVTFSVKRPGKDVKFITAYAIGGVGDDAILSKIKYISGGRTYEYDTPDLLYDGDVAVLNLQDIQDYSEDDRIKADIISTKGAYITFGTRIPNQGESTEKIKEATQIYIDQDPIVGIVIDETSRPKGISRECFDFVDTSSTGSENKYEFNILSFTGDLKMYYVNEKLEEIKELSWNINHQEALLVDKLKEDGNYLCFAPVIRDKNVTFTLQILPYSTAGSVTITSAAPAINGVSYQHKLISGARAVYRYSKRITTTEQTNFSLKVLSGNPIMYYHNYTDFPNAYTYDEYGIERILNRELFKGHDIGSFYTYSINSTDDQGVTHPKQNLMVVMCEGNKDCEFEIVFYDINDRIVLSDDSRFSQMKTADEEDQYTFRIPREQKSDDLVIVLYASSGDPYIKFEDGTDRGFIKKIWGNKQLYSLNGSSFKDINGNYNFIISSTTNSYYTIYYLIGPDENFGADSYVPNGLYYLETIPDKGNVIVHFTHNVVNDTPYMASFFAINCDITITFHGKNLPQVDSLTQHILTTEDQPYYDTGKYDYKITVNSLVQDHSSNMCMVYVLGQEITNAKGSVISIPDKTPSQFILDNTLKTLNLVYPYPKGKGDVFANFILEDEAVLDVEVYFNSAAGGKTYQFGRNKQIIIKEEDIKDKCSGLDVCTILFFVRADNEEDLKDTIKFEVNIESPFAVPAYLRLNMVREDAILSGTTQYFYIDIFSQSDFRTAMEVVVNFNRGSGTVFSRLVRNDARCEEKAEWFGQFKLPNEENDEKYYDPFTKKLSLSTEATKGCESGGCKLIIGVQVKDKYVDNQIFANDFSIFAVPILNNKRGFVDIPANEYIMGSITDTSKDSYQYYTFYVPTDSNEIVIEFQSEICDVFVGIDKQGEIAKPTRTDNKVSFISEGKNAIYRIKKSKLIGESGSLKDRIITIGINADYLDQIYTAKYVMRLRAPKKTYPVDIIEVDSDQTTMCDIRRVNSYCYFLIPFRDADYSSEIMLYANDNNPELIYEIFVNTVDANSFDNFSKEEIQEVLPTKEKNKAKGSEFLIINNGVFNKTNEDEDERIGKYILVGILGQKVGIVNFQVAFRPKLKYVVANPMSIQLFNMELIYGEKNSSMTVELPSNNNYIVHVKSIDGYGQAKFENDDESTTEISGFHDGIALVIEKGEKKSLVVSVGKSKNFRFTLEYDIRTVDENFEEIKYGQGEEFKLKGRDFPLLLYLRVIDEMQSLVLTSNFYGFSLDGKETEAFSHYFNVKAYLVDEDVINKRKSSKDVDYKEKSSKTIDGSYLSGIKVGQLLFPSKDIYDYKTEKPKYILYEFTKTEENKNKYTYIHGEFSVTSQNSERIATPIGQLNIGTFTEGQNNTNLHQLKKRDIDSDKIMKIEISSSNLVNYAIVDYIERGFTLGDAEIYYNNSTNIEIQKQEVINGKRILQVSIKDAEKILLSVFPADKQTIGDPTKYGYAFRYQSQETDFDFDFYNISSNKIDLKVTKTKNGKGEAVIEKIPQVTLKDEPVNATYYLELFDASTVTEEELENIGYSKGNILTYSTKPNVGKDFDFKISKLPKGEYYGVVKAVVDKDGEIFSYTPFKISQDSFKEESNLGLIFLIAVCVLVLLVACGIGGYFIKKNCFNSELKEKVEHTSFVGEGTNKPLITNEDVVA